jgi:light-regulated signal transduction histidine kinase (bacteriophytochrome)
VYDPGIGIPLLITVSPIFDNNGNFVGAVHYAKDITERKKAEEALEASNRELKDFVYIASHDLREPMRKISSFGEMLKDSLEDKLEEDDRENLGFMIDGAYRMTAMIDGLLTYSRIAARAVAFETVDLNEIVEQLEQVELAELLQETGAAVEVPQSLPEVKAAPVQIRQLLQNLIINGIRYRREGIQPRVVIRAEQIADGQVRVEVEDNGIGIAKEYREDVFKMFRRLHSRQEYEGTGIGLAVCKKIVERHNGQIGVESEAGAGSTFWFTLPVSESSRQEQRKLVSSLET